MWFEPTDPTLIRLLEWDGYGAVTHSNVFSAAPLLLISFSTVGIAFFQNWGRYLYLATVVYLLSSSLIFGYRIAPPLDSFFGGLSIAMMGAILGLAFLSPMRAMFRSKDAA